MEKSGSGVLVVDKRERFLTTAEFQSLAGCAAGGRMVREYPEREHAARIQERGGERALELFSPMRGNNLVCCQRGGREFLFSPRGVGPPRARGGSFHEANGGDEGVENAGVLPGAGPIAQGLVKGERVPANKVLRLLDPDRAQIAGDRRADVGNFFEDCGQSGVSCLHREKSDE
jgi:hypothetical protein